MAPTLGICQQTVCYLIFIKGMKKKIFYADALIKKRQIVSDHLSKRCQKKYVPKYYLKEDFKSHAHMISCLTDRDLLGYSKKYFLFFNYLLVIL